MPRVRFDSRKWAQRASASGGEYAEGVQNPRRPWAQSAAEAEDNYAAGVNAAISEGRFAKGVNAAGDAKWQKGVREKGRARYQQGVAIAEDEYRTGFQPYASALEGLDLGPRGPKGQNWDRVQRVGELLMEVKRAQG